MISAKKSSLRTRGRVSNLSVNFVTAHTRPCQHLISQLHHCARGRVSTSSSQLRHAVKPFLLVVASGDVNLPEKRHGN